MTTAILKAKSMVRKAREVAETVANNKNVCKVCDTIEFLVLMTLPFALPFFVMYMSLQGY
jgi:hypothetical protein